LSRLEEKKKEAINSLRKLFSQNALGLNFLMATEPKKLRVILHFHESPFTLDARGLLERLSRAYWNVRRQSTPHLLFFFPLVKFDNFWVALLTGIIFFKRCLLADWFTSKFLG
jgi:hypothetical protein